MVHPALLLVCAITFAFGNTVDGDEKYTTKYDDINVDEIINNPRILNNYINCILGKGSCTNEGKELKEHITDALQTDCSKCSEKQKEMTQKVLDHILKNEPEYWKQMEEKYDPTGAYLEKYNKSRKV